MYIDNPNSTVLEVIVKVPVVAIIEVVVLPKKITRADRIRGR